MKKEHYELSMKVGEFSSSFPGVRAAKYENFKLAGSPGNKVWRAIQIKRKGRTEQEQRHWNLGV